MFVQFNGYLLGIMDVDFYVNLSDTILLKRIFQKHFSHKKCQIFHSLIFIFHSKYLFVIHIEWISFRLNEAKNETVVLKDKLAEVTKDNEKLVCAVKYLKVKLNKEK